VQLPSRHLTVNFHKENGGYLCIYESGLCWREEILNIISTEKICIIKPTRFINFSNFFLEWNSTCFGKFLCSSSGVFNCTHSNGICHTGLQTAFEQDHDGISWSCSQAVCKSVWHIPLLCVQLKTPADGQRNCPKHVEFHSKNKFEQLVHLVCFIIQIYHDARSRERQILNKY
jgi:hypothetical protein